MLVKQQNKDNVSFLSDQLIKLHDEQFYRIVARRLDMPLSPSQMIEKGIKVEEIQYWTEERLVDELFLQIAGIKEIIRYNDQKSNHL